MISQKDLEEVLAFQKTDGRRLGTLLVERGFINETQLTQILSHQLSVPWVSLLHIEFSRQLLNLVPRSVAERFCMVPIYVRHVRGQGQTLYVAMDDPSNEDGLRACNEHSGLPVKAMIAPPSDIRNAIRVYYGVNAQSGTTTPLPSADGVAEANATQAGVDARDTQPEVSSAGAAPAAPLHERVTDTPVVEISEATLAPADLLASDPTLVSAPLEERAARQVALVVDPVVAVAVVEPAAVAPVEPAVVAPVEPAVVAPVEPAAARKKLPSAPEIPPPPETLPDPGQITLPFVDARARSRVSVVEARALPTPTLSERLRPLLDMVDDSNPPTLDDGASPPSSGPVDTIPEPRGRAPRMIALTLLDGTTISLPAPRKQRQRPDTIAQPAGVSASLDDEVAPSTIAGDDDRAGLTARDLVAALRAVCHGADPKEILGPNLRWEAVVAAMLSVLLKKGLVADWEFVDELRKI